MTLPVRRGAAAYGAIASTVPKRVLAYSAIVWMEMATQVVAIVAFVYFWRAVYAGTTTIGGLDLDATLDYVLLAQVLAPLLQRPLLLEMDPLVREGTIALELLRPLDLQGRFYAEALGQLAVDLVAKSPLLLVAVVFFGLELPASAAVWASFGLALFLGHAILFMFDWLLAGALFFTTEAWGLRTLRLGVVAFFSGSLLPLDILPPALERLAHALPFAQVLYVPVAVFTGLTPLSEMPRVWLTQGLWLAGMLVTARFVFTRCVRKVTVHGG